MLITLRGFFFNVASRMNCANHMAPKSISKSSYNLADARCVCVFHAELHQAPALNWRIVGRGGERGIKCAAGEIKRAAYFFLMLFVFLRMLAKPWI